MNSDIKQIIDDELPPGRAPVKLDVDTVVGSAHTARRNRRLLRGGGAFTCVVAVVALVVGVMSFAPGNPDTKPNQTVDQNEKSGPDTDKPVLDPDKTYTWQGGYPAKETDTSKKYTKAFWENFSERFPEAALQVDDAAADFKPVTEDLDEVGFMLAGEHLLFENEDGGPPSFPTDEDAVEKRTVLGLYERFEPGSGTNGTSCCGLTVQYAGEGSDTDRLDLEVYPQGSFTKRTEDAMDPAFLGADVKHGIKTVTGPDGEDIQHVTGSKTADDGTEDTIAHAVVVYREDGSATVFRAAPGTDGASDVSDTLSFDDLQDIALALPGGVGN